MNMFSMLMVCISHVFIKKILELRVALNKNTIYNVHMYTYGMANVVVGCYIFMLGYFFPI